MSEWLVLRLPRASGDLARWVAVSADGRALDPEQHGSLADAAAHARERRVCALLNGADVLRAELELPLRGGARLSQVAAYALEEQLVSDVELQHFAFGARDERSSRTAIAVTARALMDEALTSLRHAGIRADVLSTDTALLPVNPGHCVLLLDENNVHIAPAASAQPAICLSAADVRGALALACGAERLEQLNLLCYVPQDLARERAAELAALRNEVASLNVQVLPSGPLPWLASQFDARKVLNLLQGDYAPRSSGALHWRRWRLAAAMAALATVLFIALQAWSLFSLRREEQRVDQSLREYSTRYFDGAIGAAAVRRTAEERLIAASTGGSDRFLPALQALSTALPSANASLEALSWREQALELKLLAADAGALERVVQALRAAGWQAELIAGATRGASFEGRLKVQSGAAQ